MSARIIPLAAPNSRKLGEWAAFYARLGWRVFPVHAVRDGRCSCGKSAERSKGHESPGKHPRTPNGKNDATNDLSQIAAWWKRWPDTNIGILCSDDLVVLDVDHRNGGAETWDRALATHRIPACPFVITPGGLHVYLRDSTGRVTKRKTRLTGIDVQANGRAYVIAPPSIHPSGRRYTWAKGYGPVETRGLPEIPTSLLDELDPPRTKAAAPKPAPRTTSGPLPTPYGRKALGGLLADIASATEGHRHDVIYKVSARVGDLIRQGHLHSTSIVLLLDAALAVAGDKYTEAELARVIEDALQKVKQGGVA